MAATMAARDDYAALVVWDGESIPDGIEEIMHFKENSRKADKGNTRDKCHLLKWQL